MQTSLSSHDTSPNTELRNKTCADCGTSKTPLWRGGPSGPKSLCNACGIRSRKKRRAIMGITRGGNIDHVNKGKRSNISNKNKVGGGDSFNLKQGLWILRSNHTHHRNELGEEEQAAVLLMSLSYGSFYT